MGFSPPSFFLLLFIVSSYSSCTNSPPIPPTLLRSLGGYHVTRHRFLKSLSNKFPMIPLACLSCYADAYACGYAQCFWSCSMEGATCDQCVKSEGCVEVFNKCAK